MQTPNVTMNSVPVEISPVRLCALDHGPWLEVQQNLRRALEVRRLGRLVVPTTVILNDLLNSAVKTLHRQVFRRIMERDFGLLPSGNDVQAETLYGTEMGEHGSHNIARACESGGWQIEVSFPQSALSNADTLVQVEVPFPWDRNQCQTEKLIDALDFELRVDGTADSCRIGLVRRGGKHVEYSPELLDFQLRLISGGHIFEQLGYGLIHFSAVGEVIAASPSMLAKLELHGRADWASALTHAIPLNFHNDIIWGQALAEGSGVFENFRIRVSHLADGNLSILFNVSGFRDADGTVRSLWQVVSKEEGVGQLSEGSILSGMRIHNITRHYVPQMVEQKARDAVREGKDALTNEERRVAVLFCDIVGFTSYVERNVDNESVVDTLNFILSRVSRSVTRQNGFIDKFMGDSIMAIFDDPADAVLAAIDMQVHSEDLNRLRSRAGQQTLQLRIGIHWGEVVICNVGTTERLDWTAIGDVVNTAARIEKGCQPGAILISGATREAVDSAHPGRFRFGDAFGLQAKGKRDELAVCNVGLGVE